MAANRIVIQVDFQNQNAQQGINQLNQQIQSIGQNAQKSTQQASTGMNRLTVSVKETTDAFGLLNKLITSAALATAIKQWTEMSEAILRMAFVFERLGASGDDVKGLRSQLAGLADEIGTTQARLAGVATKLAGVFKVPPDQAAGLVKMLADISAGTTGSLENIEKIGDAFGRMIERGRVTTKELNTALLNLGIQAEPILKRVFGLQTHADVTKALSTEQTSRPAAEILRAVAEQNKGAAAALAQQLPSAQFTRALNQLQIALVQLFETLAPYLSKFLEFLTVALQLLNRLIQLALYAARVIATAFGQLFSFLDGLLSKIGKAYDWLKAKLKEGYVAIKDAIFPDEGPGFIDTEKIKQQHKAMEEALAEVRTRLSRAEDSAIGGIIDKYNHLRETLKGNAQEIARLPELYGLAAQVEIEKMGHALDAELRKMDVSINRIARQIAIIEAATPVTDTYAQRREEAGLGADARAREYAEDAQAAIRENARKVNAEIEGLRLIGGAREKQQIQQLEDQKKAFSDKTQTELLYHTARVRAEALKEIHQAEFEEWKKFYEQEAQFAEQKLNAAYTVRRAAIEAVPAQTIEDRKAQIDELGKLELDHIKEIGDAREKVNQDEWAKRLEEAKGNQAEILEINRKYANDGAAIRLETETNTQAAIVESWKETNAVIIEQQRTVYEQLQSAIGTFWDALMDRSKSVWASIANAMKSALLGAVKSIVTSNLAAALTGALGYGGVSIRRQGLWGTVPVFSGIGHGPEYTSSAISFDAATTAVGSLAVSANTATAALMGLAAGAQVATGASAAGIAGAGALTLPGMMPGMAGSTGLASGVYGNLPLSHGAGWQLPGMMPGMAGSTGIAGGGGGVAGLLKSPALTSLALGLGASMLMGGLQHGGAGGAASSVAGGAALGYGLAPMLGVSGLWGAATGAGIGLFAAGVKRGGVSGLAMTVGGGALTGYQLGGPLGAAIGAGVGAIAGIVGLFRTSKDQQVRELVRQVYGIDVREKTVRDQIVAIADSNFGGNIRLAVFSPQVMEMVRLYAQAYGASTGGLPRPMYSATLQQSTAGGLQLQPVYSGGQTVANPYVGTTTTQFNTATSGSVFMQLNPDLAMRLFSGQVVKVMGDNPGAVASANTVAATSGTSRTAQASALLEPMTVMR